MKIGNAISTIFSAWSITALMLSAMPAYAAGITVDTNADNASPGDGVCTLREAVKNANLGGDTTGTDCISGSAGADTITFTGAVTTITLGSALPDITNDVTITGNGNTIIQADACDPTAGTCTQSYRVLTITSAAVNLSDLTIRHGNVADGGGGGIFNNEGTLSLDKVIVSNNFATDGGGIHNEKGTVTVDDSTISNNEVTKDGAGIYNYDGTVTIQNGSLINKNIANDDGGGVYNHTGPLTVDASTISNNEANGDLKGNGGGICNEDADDVYVQNGSLITGNSAADYGGGFYSTDGGGGFFDKSTVSENEAVTAGGGIYLNSDALSVKSSTISGNSASDGGGIYSDNGAIHLIENSTISGNTAVNNGGGLYNTEYGEVELINNSTFSGNEITGAGNNNGANIANIPNTGASITSIKNTIIANPVGSVSCAGSGFPTAISSLDNDGTCNFGTGGNGITAGMHYNATLADNGGPTKTHALLTGSTAIDTSGPDATTDDQRGVLAVDARDIGAFEYTGDDAALVVVSSDPSDGSTKQNVTELTVTFSKDVVVGNPSGGNSTANYLLVERGANEVFDTQSCLGTAQSDDSEINVDTADFVSTNKIILGVNGGSALPDGIYRLFVCGTTSVYDLIGLPLNGGLNDSQIDFTIGAVAAVSARPVPTLSTWALGMLGLLLSATVLRRRKQLA